MSKTFGEYCGIEISRKAERIANTVERVDIVFDVYRKAPRKQETLEGRGKNERDENKHQGKYPCV